MPPLALAGGGLAAGAIGGALGAGASNSVNYVNNPAPTPLYGGLNTQYLQQLSGLLGGTGTGGAAGTGAAGTLQSMIATGNPTNVGPAYQALVAAEQPQIAQGTANVEGAFSGIGARYGSEAATGVSNYQSQVSSQFLSTLANYTMNAQENAANRQLSASQTALGLASGPATQTYQSSIPVLGGQSVLGSLFNSGGNALSFLGMASSLGLF